MSDSKTDPFDAIAKERGWKPLVVRESMTVTYGTKQYMVERLPDKTHPWPPDWMDEEGNVKKDPTKTTWTFSNNAIWKYTLQDIGSNKVFMPKDAKIIHADNQDGHVTLWAIVDPGATLVENRYFCVIGTGFKVPERSGFVGTVIVDQFVWHVFEVIR